MGELLIPTNEEIKALPFSEVIRIRPQQNCVIINEIIGIGFDDNEHITIMCDKRIPIKRSNSSYNTQKTQPAEIGALTLTLNNEIVVFVGNDFPLVIRRFSDRNSAPIIKVSHTEALDVGYFDFSVFGLKSKLKLGLVG